MPFLEARANCDRPDRGAAFVSAAAPWQRLQARRANLQWPVMWVRGYTSSSAAATASFEGCTDGRNYCLHSGPNSVTTADEVRVAARRLCSVAAMAAAVAVEVSEDGNDFLTTRMPASASYARVSVRGSSPSIGPWSSDTRRVLSPEFRRIGRFGDQIAFQSISARPR